MMSDRKALRVIVLSLLVSLLAAEPAFARARHLHPAAGRFMQRDPAGYVDGMSAYEYEKSRPMVGLDPTGNWDLGGGLGGSSTIMLPAAGFSPGLSLSYSVAFVIGRDPTTRSWFCGWCDSGAVTVLVGAGAAFNVSVGPVVTAGLGGLNQIEGQSVQLGVGVGLPTNPTATSGVEFIIDYAVNTGQVTIHWPALAKGVTAYGAIRVSGTCTGCTKGLSGLVSKKAIRVFKIKSCLAKVQSALNEAIKSLDGKVVAENKPGKTTFTVGDANGDPWSAP